MITIIFLKEKNIFKKFFFSWFFFVCKQAEENKNSVLKFSILYCTRSMKIKFLKVDSFLRSFRFIFLKKIKIKQIVEIPVLYK